MQNVTISNIISSKAQIPVRRFQVLQIQLSLINHFDVIGSQSYWIR